MEESWFCAGIFIKAVMRRLFNLSCLLCLCLFDDVLSSSGDKLQWNANCGLSSFKDAGEGFGNVTRPIAHIVGGITPRRHEFPYMVSIRRWPGEYSQHFCGAALITERWILTAAHCVYYSSPGRLMVVLGEHRRRESDWNSDARHRVKIEPESIHVHPSYNPRQKDHDIALVKLSESAKFTVGVQPVCAPKMNLKLAGDYGIVTGWGDTFYGSKAQSDYLQWIKTPIQTNEACQERFGAMTQLTENMMCGGRLYEDEMDACQADSGGPMTVKIEGRFHVVGLVSYGYQCASGYPGVYTRVSQYVDWISEVIRNK